MQQLNVKTGAVFTALAVFLFSTQLYSAPVCERSDSDSDGDGYGWENGDTCLVEVGSGSASNHSNRSGSRELPTCRDASSDSDGDGFGWESNGSCRVASASIDAGNTKPQCRSATSDSDGDGFGWEDNRSCVVSLSAPSGQVQTVPLTSALPEERVVLRLPACSDQRFDPDGDSYGWENSRSCTFKNAGDGGRTITDVILVTGQSNALGAETKPYDPYDAALDSPVRRVYAYTENGWSIAGLEQIWDLGWIPRGDIGSAPANNFAFHFGKSLVRKDPDAVVGIIMVTAPGAGIEHWDIDGPFFDQINARVRRALEALPGDARVQGILWHQGETDFYRSNHYRNQLKTLIGNFRDQRWLADDAVFICGETLNSPVNANLLELNSDGDPSTGCVVASDLESIGDDVHFNADSLRTLGMRYSEEYQSLRR